MLALILTLLLQPPSWETLINRVCEIKGVDRLSQEFFDNTVKASKGNKHHVLRALHTAIFVLPIDSINALIADPAPKPPKAQIQSVQEFYYTLVKLEKSFDLYLAGKAVEFYSHDYLIKTITRGKYASSQKWEHHRIHSCEESCESSEHEEIRRSRK